MENSCRATLGNKLANQINSLHPWSLCPELACCPLPGAFGASRTGTAPVAQAGRIPSPLSTPEWRSSVGCPSKKAAVVRPLIIHLFSSILPPSLPPSLPLSLTSTLAESLLQYASLIATASAPRQANMDMGATWASRVSSLVAPTETCGLSR